MGHITRFLAICLSFVGVLGATLERAITYLTEAFLVAFPPDPNAVLARQNFERAIADDRQRRRDSRFAAFIARAKSHTHYLGGRFKLLRSPLLAV